MLRRTFLLGLMIVLLAGVCWADTYFVDTLYVAKDTLVSANWVPYPSLPPTTFKEDIDDPGTNDGDATYVSHGSLSNPYACFWFDDADSTGGGARGVTIPDSFKIIMYSKTSGGSGGTGVIQFGPAYLEEGSYLWGAAVDTTDDMTSSYAAYEISTTESPWFTGNPLLWIYFYRSATQNGYLFRIENYRVRTGFPVPSNRVTQIIGVMYSHTPGGAAPSGQVIGPF
jgi:hypothetical protein